MNWSAACFCSWVCVADEAEKCEQLFGFELGPILDLDNYDIMKIK